MNPFLRYEIFQFLSCISNACRARYCFSIYVRLSVRLYVQCRTVSKWMDVSTHF